MALAKGASTPEKVKNQVSGDTEEVVQTPRGMCIHNIKGVKRPFPRKVKLPSDCTKGKDIVDNDLPVYRKAVEGVLQRNSLKSDCKSYGRDTSFARDSYHFQGFDIQLNYDEVGGYRRHWCFKSHCEYWYFACRCKFLNVPSHLGRYLWFQYIAACKPDEQYQKRFAQVFYQRLCYLVRSSSQLNSIALFDYGMNLRWLDPHTKNSYLLIIERLIILQKSLYIAGFEQAMLKPIEAIRLLLALSLGVESTLQTLYAWQLFNTFTCPTIGYYHTTEEYYPFMKKELKKTEVREEIRKRIRFEDLKNKELTSVSIINLIGPESKTKSKLSTNEVKEPDAVHVDQNNLKNKVSLDDKPDQLEEKCKKDKPSLVCLFQGNMGEDQLNISDQQELIEEISNTSTLRWIKSLVMSGMADKLPSRESFSNVRREASIHEESSVVTVLQAEERFQDEMTNENESVVSDVLFNPGSNSETFLTTSTSLQKTEEEEDMSLYTDEYEESEIINLDGQIDFIEDEEENLDEGVPMDLNIEGVIIPDSVEGRVHGEDEPMVLEEEVLNVFEIEVESEAVAVPLELLANTPTDGTNQDIFEEIWDEGAEAAGREGDSALQEPPEKVLMTLTLSERDSFSDVAKMSNSELTSFAKEVNNERIITDNSSEFTTAHIIGDNVDKEVSQTKVPNPSEKIIECEVDIEAFVDYLIAIALRKVVEMFASTFIYEMMLDAEEKALNKLIADDLERNRPDICLLSEFKEVGLTKEHIKNDILSGLYFPLDAKKRMYYSNDPLGTRKACYDYIVKHQYSKINIQTMRMIYRISLVGLNRLTKLCINFCYLADSTGETLLSIGAIQEGCLVELKLLCVKEETPSSNCDKYETSMNHNIPDIAWRKAKFLAPNLGVHLVMLCVHRYNVASKFTTKNMPLVSIHLSTGYRGVKAGQFALWYFDYTMKMLTFYPHTLQALSFYVWHSRERLDNLIKRMLEKLFNLKSFEYYGTLQYLRTMDEICLYFLQHKTKINMLALYKIEDPCLGTKLRSEINERRDKYGPMFKARDVTFNMGTFCL